MMHELPYDRWLAPDGEVIAEFLRAGSQYLVRFPGKVDFQISADCREVIANPCEGADADEIERLRANAISPMIGNHGGGLFLHGSAITHDKQAIAFVGPSRSGKTTLAGSFATNGHRLLTEDAIELECDGESYMLQPRSHELRLFPDSAAHLFNEKGGDGESDCKRSYGSGDALDIADRPVALRAIFVLVGDKHADVDVTLLPAARALPALMPHSFLLDVEDKKRLRGHFERLAALASRIPVFALHLPHDYSVLSEVRRTVVEAAEQGRTHEPD